MFFFSSRAERNISNIYIYIYIFSDTLEQWEFGNQAFELVCVNRFQGENDLHIVIRKLGEINQIIRLKSFKSFEKYKSIYIYISNVDKSYEVHFRRKDDQ